MARGRRTGRGQADQGGSEAKGDARSQGQASRKPREVQPKLSGETVRAFMDELSLSGKDLAAAGGFSVSRVAELRQVGDLPASWGGRDRHATVTQWTAVEKAARALAAKRDKAATK